MYGFDIFIGIISTQLSMVGNDQTYKRPNRPIRNRTQEQVTVAQQELLSVTPVLSSRTLCGDGNVLSVLSKLFTNQS